MPRQESSVPAPARRLSIKASRALLWAAACVLVAVLSIAPLSNFLLRHWLEAKLERSFARRHPGFQLRTAAPNYQFWENRLSYQSLELSNTLTGWSCRSKGLSARGIARVRLLLGKRRPTDVLRKATLHADTLVVVFPKSLYSIYCEHFEASVSKGQITIGPSELRPFVSDETFFAARPYRRIRYDLNVAGGSVEGLDARALLAAQAYRAESVRIERPVLQTLLPLDFPPNPQPGKPVMLHDLLNRLKAPLDLKSVILTNGRVVICERLHAGDAPASLTFEDASLRAQPIVTHLASSTPTEIEARSTLMNAATLNLRFSIQLGPPELSLRYSGELGDMDLRTLNPFMEVAGHTRIKSGQLHSASFNATVQSGVAIGQLQGIYEDLQIALLDRETLTETGAANRLKTFFADHIALRTSNLPSRDSPPAVGKINYARKPTERELHFLWFAVRNGFLDLIGLSDYIKSAH